MTANSENRQHIDAVLVERARLLARPVVEMDAAPMVKLVEFNAGNQHYAIEAAFVYRLELLGKLTPLPGAARWFAGITNLHGQLVPLIELGLLLATAPCATPSFVVVLGEWRAEIGILADMLLDMRTLPLAAFGSPAAPRALVRHITPDGTAVIDGAALIADPRLVAVPSNEEHAR